MLNDIFNVASDVNEILQPVAHKVTGLCLIGAASNCSWSNVNGTVYEWDETVNKMRAHTLD